MFTGQFKDGKGANRDVMFQIVTCKNKLQGSKCIDSVSVLNCSLQHS